VKIACLLAVSAVPLLAGCGFSYEEFGQECQNVAGIEVRDKGLWQEYLRERKQELSQTKVTVDWKEIDPTDINPVVFTKDFEWTNDWVLNGRPSISKGDPYRNDQYVVQRFTGRPVARFRNLSVSVPNFGSTVGYSCTTDYPHLYTGARRHRGMIGIGPLESAS
jgi:hypothetical protein